MNLKPFYPMLGVLLLGGLLAYKVTAPPLQDALTTRSTLQDDIATLEQTVQTLPAETVRHERLQQDYAALKARLPDTEHLPGVLRTLSDTARALNVRADKIDRSVRPSSIPGVTAVDLDVSLVGTYARTQAYIQTLARLPRAYTTRSVTFSAGDHGLVTGSLKLTTYTRDNTTPAATPATGTTPPSTGTMPLSPSPTSGRISMTPNGSMPTSATPLAGATARTSPTSPEVNFSTRPGGAQ
ncbi:type 4a pilus biogenesis protein PilO [Deinococcus ruber]|uniref:Pilus assembly protein PilO n=1 Tax=Deinococcus ruber TaxID=1848197 RepID=A0A918CMW4_9DEIO|nr:type 4a pilus biogenesis protein PilO [Deinococcus ruber]GGR32694.1 hypothetical protein GCM10008957_48940 [Deinococcus ruber]